MKVDCPSVLLIYTGGTIGMIENPETGALENFNFDQLLQHVPELKRFNYRISSYQFDPPIDSSDMEPSLWAKIVKIINYNYDSTGAPPAGASEGSSASGTEAQEAQAVQEEIDKAQQDQSAAESQAQAVEDAVDEDTAVSIALEHAGVTEASFHRVELDYEDGREVYEIEFFSGNTEYDYTVARDTGEILSYDQDIEGWGLGQGNGQGNGNGRQNGQGNSTSSTAAGPITLEEAVQLVLDRVPGASSEDVRIQLEEEDGRQVYEGEVICNRAEHEFEIDAATGDFIQWSVDYQD